MAKTILSTTRTTAVLNGQLSGGLTTYFWCGYATLLSDTTEANRQITYRAAGTVSKLYVRVISNSLTNSTVTLRKNGVDTPLTVTIPSSTNGAVEDTSNSVSVAAGDKLSFKSVGGTGASLTFTIISVVYDTTTDCTTRYVTEGYGVAVGSASHFLPIAGSRSGTTTGEANCENTIKTAGTAKNFFIYVSANARTTNTTFTLRKNRVDTAVVFTYGSGATGIQENTATTVSFAADDELDWEITTLTGTPTLTFQCLVCDYETTTKGVLTRGNVGSTADVIQPAPSITWYYPIGGGALEGTTTEAEAQQKAREAFTFSNLILYSGTNTVSSTSTFLLRVNGADTALTLSVGASATGFFVDITHTVTVAAGDLVCLKLLTGTTGISMTTRQFGVTVEAAAGGANIVRALPTETISISDGATRLASKTRSRSETITIGETPTRQTTKQRAIPTQTVVIAENAARVKGKVKALATETVTIGGGTATRLAAKTRPIVQTTAITDLANRLAAKNRSPANETVTIGGGTVSRIKGKVKTLSETVNVGDVLVRLANKARAISQTVSISDSIARRTAKIRAISQTIVIAENLAKSTTKLIIRSLSDTVTIGESIARLANKTRPITQTVPISDSTARQTNKIRVIPQTVTISESLARVKGKIKSISQTVAVSESLNRLAAKTRAISQTVTVGDSLNRLTTKIRAIATEIIAITDSVARFVENGQNNVVRSITQTIIVSESLNRLTAKTRAISQTVSISENAARLAAKSRALATQTVTVGPGVLNKLKSANKQLIQTITLGESLTRLTNKFRTISQTVTAGESLTKSKGVSRFLATQTIIIGESLTRLKGSIRTISQTTVISENLNRLASKARTLSQITIITDSVTRTTTTGQEIVRSITQTVIIGESLVRRVTKSRSFIETTPIVELATRLAAKKRALATQTVVIADAVTRLKLHNIVRAIPVQTVTIGESLARRTTKARSIFQALTVADILQGFKNGVELVAPIIEPPNLIGIRKLIVPKPRYVIRVKEVTTVEQQANAAITIPAFKYQINKAWSSVAIVEWVQKATARLVLALRERTSISSPLVLIQQIKQLSASKIQIPADYKQRTKSKIVNPSQHYRIHKLVRLFSMVEKVD